MATSTNSTPSLLLGCCLLIVWCFARSCWSGGFSHSSEVPSCLFIPDSDSANFLFSPVSDSGTTHMVIVMQKCNVLCSSSANRHGRLFIFLSIILSGQVESNPGPVQYPCGVCENSVHDSHQAILCDGCDMWFHTSCSGVSTDEYQDLLNFSDFSWNCILCNSINFHSALHSVGLDNLSTPNSFSNLDAEIGEFSDFVPVFQSSPRDHSSRPYKAKPHVLKAMAVNCNSLVSPDKRAQFHAHVEAHKPDIIFGSESKLDSSIPTYSVFPDNYLIHRKDRVAGGGGVFLAIREDIVSVDKTQLDKQCESVWSSVTFSGSKQLFLCSFYQIPNSNSESLLELRSAIEEIYQSHSNTQPNIILAGDFNLPNVNWTDLNSTDNKQITTKNTMFDLITDFNMTQMVTQVTRQASQNILDLVVTNNPNLVGNVQTHSGISDHDIVIFEINVNPRSTPKPSHTVFVYSKTDTEKLLSDIDKAKQNFFSSNPQLRTIEENWQLIKDAITKSIKDNIPTRRTKIKHNLPWITITIKRQMRKKERLHKIAKTNPQKPRLWLAFKNQRNKVVKLIKDAHNSYIGNVVGQALLEDPKKFWSYVSRCRRESLGIPTLVLNGLVCADNKSKAQALNDQFSSVFTRENSDVPDKGPSPHPSISNITVSEAGVHKLLKELKPNKAAGPDQLPPRVLKMIADPLAPMLTFLFQQTLDQGILPSDWVYANVCGIYKKGDKSKPENYRPVSLTCIVCKIAEHIVLSHVGKHLAANNIVIENQHGFRENLSCVTQLIQCISDWSLTLDHSGQTDVLMLDFSKAFDTVPHRRLLSKLKFYGINGKTAGWIKAFLSNRKQSVVVNGLSSADCDVISGVPQGSVLGPTLFLLYINDIGDNLNSTLRLFADDSILYREIKNQSDKVALQEDLDKISEWSDKWQMLFNVNKCYHIQITRKHKPLKTSYSMKGELISIVQDNKYLGVTISNDLRWSKHCNKIAAKARSTLGIVRRSLHSANKEIKAKAFQALVRPQLEYASEAWNPYTDKDTKTLQRVQNAAARFTLSDYNRSSSVTAMQDQLGWDSLAVRRLQSQICMFYKIHCRMVNISFPSYIQIVARPSSRVPHHSQYLRVSASKDSFFYSFYPRMIPVWNSLPQVVVSASSFDSFKSLSSPVVKEIVPPKWCKRI